MAKVKLKQCKKCGSRTTEVGAKDWCPRCKEYVKPVKEA